MEMKSYGKHKSARGPCDPCDGALSGESTLDGKFWELFVRTSTQIPPHMISDFASNYHTLRAFPSECLNII